MANKFIKKHGIEYIVCKMGVEQSEQNVFICQNKVSREIIKKYCTRRTQVISSVPQTEHTVAWGW